jgi:hypothetical protein
MIIKNKSRSKLPKVSRSTSIDAKAQNQTKMRVITGEHQHEHMEDEPWIITFPWFGEIHRMRDSGGWSHRRMQTVISIRVPVGGVEVEYTFMLCCMLVRTLCIGYARDDPL